MFRNLVDFMKTILKKLILKTKQNKTKSREPYEQKAKAEVVPSINKQHFAPSRNKHFNQHKGPTCNVPKNFTYQPIGTKETKITLQIHIQHYESTMATRILPTQKNKYR